jgi:hypothetical protein
LSYSGRHTGISHRVQAKDERVLGFWDAKHPQPKVYADRLSGAYRRAFCGSLVQLFDFTAFAAAFKPFWPATFELIVKQQFPH